MIPVRVDSDEGRAPLCASAVLGMVSIGLIIAVLQPTFGELYRDYGLVPARLLSPESWSLLGPFAQVRPLFTYVWLHDGLWHLGVNVWWLWIFGSPIERHVGSLRFGISAFALMWVSAIGHALISSTSIAPLVGSSGLVAGCMGMYVLVMPRGRVLMLVPTALPWTINLQAGWFVGGWIALQFILAMSARGVETEVAWWAHVVGFICGLFVGRWVGSQERVDDDVGPKPTATV
jgi:membrane associated rhomboid family serine protease